MKLKFIHRVAGYIIAGILLFLAWLNLDMWRVNQRLYALWGYDIDLPLSWGAFMLLAAGLATLLVIPAVIRERHIGVIFMSFRSIVAVLLLITVFADPYEWSYFSCHHTFSHEYFDTCGEYLRLTETTPIVALAHSLLPLVVMGTQMIRKGPNKILQVIACYARKT